MFEFHEKNEKFLETIRDFESGGIELKYLFEGNSKFVNLLSIRFHEIMYINFMYL